MHVKVIDDGSTLMDQDWNIRTSIPTYRTPAWSGTLTIQGLPFEDITSFSDVLTGRDSKWLCYGLGDQGLSVEFRDGYGAAAYHAATFSAECASSGVPESGLVAMLCTGILALAAMRRLLVQERQTNNARAGPRGQDGLPALFLGVFFEAEETAGRKAAVAEAPSCEVHGSRENASAPGYALNTSWNVATPTA